MRTENLRPLGKATDAEGQERERRIHSAGAFATAEKRREKRAMRELAQQILDMTAPAARTTGSDNADIAELAQTLASEQGRNLSNSQAVLVAQIAKALAGDTRAAEYVRDTAGEKPTDRVQAEVNQLTEGDRLLIDKLAKMMDSQ